MSEREFVVRVHREEGSLWAEVPELPGCFASGETLDELRDALEESISLYLHDKPNAPPVLELHPLGAGRRLEIDELRVRVPG